MWLALILGASIAERQADGSPMISNDDLVRELDRLDVPFLYSDLPAAQDAHVDPVTLLASLAASDEARVRLAIIPLLLRRPELAGHAPAAQLLFSEAQVALKCYTAAAVILQQKYAQRLRALGLPGDGLPDWFSAELGVPAGGGVDERLAALARRHAALSGDDINWAGTYEHGAQSFMKFYQHRLRWKQSSTQTS
jgi:hypothetical protein